MIKVPAVGTLARWLGPWADPVKSPDVIVMPDEIDGIDVNVYHHTSMQVRKRFLIAPGLHYAGPDDPRLDRFCKILAAAGHQVIAPFIPAYLALTPNTQAIADFNKVFDAYAPRDKSRDKKPIIFSISFGSLLAFALAAERGAQIERLVIFGGYAEFHETMKFCLTGEVSSGREATRDPLNQPVVLMNLLDHMEHERSQARALIEGWRTYVTRTWGRPELKARDKFTAIAEEMAPRIPHDVRELFLIGIGARPGASELAMAALEKFDATALDPSPYLPRITNRVDLVHGMDDDVIPYEQSHVLASRLTNADVRTHITGLYGHTGAHRPQLRMLAKELATMVRVLRVLAG